MDEVTIKPMEIVHLPEVLAIEREVFPNPWSSEVFLHELYHINVSRSFVALVEERVLGYSISWFVEDEVHIINIAVAPREQRRRVGSLLMEHLIELAHEERRGLITLEVRTSNETAIAFYRSFSFRELGVRKGYYSDTNEDALLMILDVEDYMRKKREGGWQESG